MTSISILVFNFLKQLNYIYIFFFRFGALESPEVASTELAEGDTKGKFLFETKIKTFFIKPFD